MRLATDRSWFPFGILLRLNGREVCSLKFWTPTGSPIIILNTESGSTLKLKSTLTLNTGEWYHLAATWEVNIYDRVLSDTEVWEHYQALADQT